MNQTHLHLLITHLPIVGSILGALVLIHGMGVKSNQTIIAAYYIFILCAMGAGVAYFTGEAAEESVEHLPGVVEATIKQHEDIAWYAFISLIALGMVSILGVFIAVKNLPFTRTMAFVMLMLSLLSFGLVARTGYLGGQIRHTETQTFGQAPQGENEDD